MPTAGRRSTVVAWQAGSSQKENNAPLSEDVQNTLHEKSTLKNNMCGMTCLYFFHIESELNISGRTYKRLSKKVLKKVRLESHRKEKATVN